VPARALVRVAAQLPSGVKAPSTEPEIKSPTFGFNPTAEIINRCAPSTPRVGIATPSATHGPSVQCRPRLPQRPCRPLTHPLLHAPLPCSRAAMIGFFGIIIVEAIAGKGILNMLGLTVGGGLGIEL